MALNITTNTQVALGQLTNSMFVWNVKVPYASKIGGGLTIESRWAYQRGITVLAIKQVLKFNARGIH